MCVIDREREREIWGEGSEVEIYKGERGGQIKICVRERGRGCIYVLKRD